ncbi:hypothetical protein ACFLW0_05320 [Chloroflexota bacterium]
MDSISPAIETIRTRSSIKIGRFLRTRIRIHYSWILAIILITLAVTTQFSTESSLLLRILYGVAASVVFFFTIIARELVLILLAAYKGVVIESVIIFPFLGLFKFDRETTAPSHELLIAVTGMLYNLIITAAFYIAYLVSGKSDIVMIDVLLRWLAFLYMYLSLFHILPAFPLEGGRILHAILWKALDDVRRSTVISSWIGWATGLILIAGGISLLVLTGETFTGTFLIAIGLILQNAATHSRRQQSQATEQETTGTSEAPDSSSIISEIQPN